MIVHGLPNPHNHNRRAIYGNGRHTSLTVAQMKNILAHFTAIPPKATQKLFCEINGISLSAYKRVAFMTFKQEEDLFKVRTAASVLNIEYNGGRWVLKETITRAY